MYHNTKLQSDVYAPLQPNVLLTALVFGIIRTQITGKNHPPAHHTHYLLCRPHPIESHDSLWIPHDSKQLGAHAIHSFMGMVDDRNVIKF